MNSLNKNICPYLTTYESEAQVIVGLTQAEVELFRASNGNTQSAITPSTRPELVFEHDPVPFRPALESWSQIPSLPRKKLDLYLKLIERNILNSVTLLIKNNNFWLKQGRPAVLLGVDWRSHGIQPTIAKPVYCHVVLIIKHSDTT